MTFSESGYQYDNNADGVIEEMYDSIYEFDEEGNLTHQEETTYQYDNNGDGFVDQLNPTHMDMMKIAT